MIYNELTREEKIHIEEVYSVIADCLEVHYETDPRNIANIMEDGSIKICRILYSMLSYDTVILKLNPTFIPLDKGEFILKFEDDLTQRMVNRNIIRYLSI